MNQIGEGQAYIQKSGMVSVAASWPPWYAIVLQLSPLLYLAESSFVKRGEDVGVHGTQGMPVWTNNVTLSFQPDA